MTSRLIALHKGTTASGGDTRFFYNTYDGTTWSGDRPVEHTAGLTDSPAAVEFNGDVYTFYPRNHEFWFNKFDGQKWSGEKPVPNTAGLHEGVTAAVFRKKIHLLYSSPGDGSRTLMHRTYDGTDFSEEAPAEFSSDAYDVLGTPASVAVALKGMAKRLYVFCRGPRRFESYSDNRFWYASYKDGSVGGKWHAAAVGNTPGIANSPSVAAYQGLIYLFFKEPDGRFCVKTFDGDHWAVDAPLPNANDCVANAAAAPYGKSLYVLYQGPGHRFNYQTLGPASEHGGWSGDLVVGNTGGITASPAVAVLPN